jgi:acyl dehydratase
MQNTFTYDEIVIGHEVAGPQLTVTREAIKEFATASFDHNPLHWDDRFLEETTFAGNKKFDDVIQHGLMTYSLMLKTMTDWLWPDNGNHRRLETRFKQPIYPGDHITVSAKVVDKRKTAKGKWLTCEVTVQKADGTIAATGEALAEILN